ncbi:MAG: hypothetical protein JWN07_708 [Hyphomicrobiales bacterium]|nr:hypothetical protein [Hyphomicrobiales bacterium]
MFFSISRFLPVVLAALLSAPAALAQDGSMKACGEKWQAAKAANATQGATWPKFLTECRASLAQPAVAVAAVTNPPSAKAQDAAPPAAAGAAASPVFPGAVPAKFADLRPSQARQKTCSEQYQANKATNGNAGMRWLEKGGGYWSLCNRKLKGA